MTYAELVLTSFFLLPFIISFRQLTRARALVGFRPIIANVIVVVNNNIGSCNCNCRLIVNTSQERAFF